MSQAASSGGTAPRPTRARSVRVVHVVDSLADSGGAEQRLVEEAIALGSRFDQRVVRLFERDHLQPLLEAAGIPVVELGLQSRHAGRTWLLAARRLRAVLRAWPPDVVHTTLFTGNLVGQLAARSLELPVVSSFNRTGERELQRSLQPGASSWRGRAMLAIARRVSTRGDVRFRAVSAYARESNCELYGIPRDRVTVIPRGVKIDRAHVDARRESFGLKGYGPLYVNVARLVPEKAQHLLVEAFAGVRAELPDAELAIAGAPGSAERAVRDAVARHGLDDAVHLLGFRADARGLVAAADVFVFSSVSEGSPSAVLEAMAVGTPVVAFAIPPVVEITGAGGNARLVPSGSTEDLARAMVAAYRSPERESEVRRARSWAGQFGLEVVAVDLGDLLESRARGSELVVRDD